MSPPSGCTTYAIRQRPLWLRKGVGLKTVSDLLGHSSVAITGDVYGHVMPETARAASDVMAGLLG